MEEAYDFVIATGKTRSVGEFEKLAFALANGETLSRF